MDKINYPGSDSQSWNQHQILNPAKLSCLLRIVTLLADVVAETPPPHHIHFSLYSISFPLYKHWS